MKFARRLGAVGFVFALLAVLFLAGCSQDHPEATGAVQSTPADAEAASGEAGDQGAGNDAAFPITIEHAFGETVIPSKPERVATIAWANHDVALALDVVPVGFCCPGQRRNCRSSA